MSGNWLETAGSWLGKPFRALLAPWWERLVEGKAESAAVKSKVLEAIVRFRVSDCQRKLKLDAHKAEGITQRVIEQVRPIILNGKLSVSSPECLKRIECAIELQALPLSVWVELACLCLANTFDPHNAIVVNFTNDDGSQSHASTMIAAFQDAFPFTRILAMSSFDQARISPEAIASLNDYCASTILPEASFEIAAEVNPTSFFDPTLANPRNLPRGWKPLT